MNPDKPSRYFLSNRKTQYWLLFGLLVVFAATGSRYYLSSSKDKKSEIKATSGNNRFHRDEDMTVSVAVETTKLVDFPVYLDGLGTVVPLKTVTVRPRVDGEIIRVDFTEGQNVKQGELLAEIDPRPFQIQLQQAEGQLLRDQALLDNAQTDYVRYQTLLKQDSIAAQQVMTQQAQVKQYQGLVAMDKAQVNNARLQLSYARVTAPVSGQAGLRQIDQGNVVHAGETSGLVVITQLQPITVVFTLPEDKVQKVTQRFLTRQPINVSAYDRAGKIKLAEGKLLALDNQIDSTTGTFKLKAVFDNLNNALFANQFVNIRMHLETLNNVTEVSTSAIGHDAKGAFVYVVSPEKTVALHLVTLGATEGDKVVVLDNLAANEMVVVEGADRLKEGSKVDISEKDGQTVAASPVDSVKPDSKPRKKFRQL